MTIDGRSYSHEVLEHYRFRAFELYEEGKKVNDIADFLGMHCCSVSHWITSYKLPLYPQHLKMLTHILCFFLKSNGVLFL